MKALEELGIGRPSTYASILGTIQNRGYVWKKGTALVPSFTAFAVVGLLERYFGDLVDYGFTAAMEDDLDEIAQGAHEALPWLTRFYFGGNGSTRAHGRAAARGLKEDVASHLGEIDAREVNSIPIGTDAEGEPIVVRVGRYGPYLQRGERPGLDPRGPRPPTSSPWSGRGAPGGAVGGPHPRRPTRQRAPRDRPVGPLRSLRPAGRGGRRRDRPRTASLFKP